MKFVKSLFIFSAASLLIAGCSKNDSAQSYFQKEKNLNIEHVHGMGYIKGNLFLATHEGLVKYDTKDWYSTTSNNHDYMGFQAVDNGFYSSGHPEEGSSLKNPLGIVKSTDEGKNLKKLGLYGETDFHYLAAGYNSHTLYALNHEPNSKMDSGFYYSDDDGKTWNQSRTEGLSAQQIGNIDTHPTKSEVVSISTDQGIFLSNDNGNTFKQVTNSPVNVVEVLEDKLLYFELNGDKSGLYQAGLDGNDKSSLSLPEGINAQNPVTFIAVHPKNKNEITILTGDNSIYKTNKNGTDWSLLIKNGKN